MMCLESAGRLPLADYRRATIYTTLSPNAMCAGAILHYQIPRCVIADSEHFQGEEARHSGARAKPQLLFADASALWVFRCCS